MIKLAVFASGSGTNMQAIAAHIAQGKLHASIVLLVCDTPSAAVIEKAKGLNIPCFVFDPKQYANKAAYEKEICEVCARHQADLLVLAGYMRLCKHTLLEEYEGRIINIHPSLLPSFPGKDAIGQAIAYGVKVMGITVHYVDAGMDSGKIIAQRALDVSGMQSREEIEAHIHQMEHQLYSEVLQTYAEEENEKKSTHQCQR